MDVIITWTVQGHADTREDILEELHVAIPEVVRVVTQEDACTVAHIHIILVWIIFFARAASTMGTNATAATPDHTPEPDMLILNASPKETVVARAPTQDQDQILVNN